MTVFLLVLLLIGGGIFLKRFVPPILATVLVVVGGSLVWVACFRFAWLWFLLTVVALLFRGAVQLREVDREQDIRQVKTWVRADVADLNTLTGFSQTLAALQARWALGAHRQGQGMAEELEAALNRLAAAGALTSQVRRELVQLTESHLARMHALTEEGQAFLVRLAARYDPRTAPKLWLRLVTQRWQRRIPV